MSINLHIDRLILQGFTTVDREQLVVAVEEELSRLLSESGTMAALTGSKFAGRLDGGSFALAPNMSTESIAAHVAQAVYGVLLPQGAE